MEELDKLRALEEQARKVVLSDPQFLRQAFEKAPDSMIAVDGDAIIVAMNEQAELMFGYIREELLLKPLEVLIPEDRRAAHTLHFAKFMKDPRLRQMGIDMPLNARHRTGRLIAVEIHLGPMAVASGTVTLATIRRK